MGFEAEGFYGPYILPVNQTNSVKALNVLRQQNEQHQLQFVSLSVIFINISAHMTKNATIKTANRLKLISSMCCWAR